MSTIRTVDQTTAIVVQDSPRTVLTPGPSARSIEARTAVVEVRIPGPSGPASTVPGPQGEPGADGAGDNVTFNDNLALLYTVAKS